MGDLTPYVSSIVTIVVAVVGGYVAMKNANAEKFNSLSVQIAMLSQQVVDLREDVEKHNSVVERVFKLESDNATAFKRIDELRTRDDKLENKVDRLEHEHD